jgi:Peptidase family M23
VGNAVFIDHGDGLVSMYFHLAEINVNSGEEVKKGQLFPRVQARPRRNVPALTGFDVTAPLVKTDDDPGELVETDEGVASIGGAMIVGDAAAADLDYIVEAILAFRPKSKAAKKRSKKAAKKGKG